jgi:uncharacterized membrane protein
VPIVAAVASLSVGLLAYLAVFPEIKLEQKPQPSSQAKLQTLDAVKRVLKDDERKVIELIINTGGSMLQSDIARQTGFSRVKTHRILYRLSTRGIIVAQKHYNTYKITLAEWLLPMKK